MTFIDFFRSRRPALSYHWLLDENGKTSRRTVSVNHRVSAPISHCDERPARLIRRWVLVTEL
jgi:hypothetical protein